MTIRWISGEALNRPAEVFPSDKFAGERHTAVLEEAGRWAGGLVSDWLWEETPLLSQMEWNAGRIEQAEALLHFWEQEMVSSGHRVLLAKAPPSSPLRTLLEEHRYKNTGGMLYEEQKLVLLFRKIWTEGENQCAP